MKKPVPVVLILTAAGIAHADPQWTYEARSIHGNVYAAGTVNGDFRSSESSMQPFQASVAPTISGMCSWNGVDYGEAFATASASQDSAITAHGVVGSGSAEAVVGEMNPDVACGGDCDSSCDALIEFLVPEDTTYSLVFAFTASGGVSAINLYNRTTDTYPIQVSSIPGTTISGEQAGALPAGRYMFDFSAAAEAHSSGATSTAASVRFSFAIAPAARCPADFNQDGGVDGGDVESFFLAWEQGDSAADVNQDGGVDGSDVATFFLAWEAGGC